MAKRYKNDTVMVWSDLHAPYQHKHALEFLGDIKQTYKPDRIVCLGDLLDMYSVSSYPKDINHKDSWSKEIKNARKVLKEIGKLFPKMDVMSSNHDDRLAKKAGVAGVPREFLVPYRTVVDAPEEWVWKDRLSLTIDSTREKLCFAHTLTGGALAGAKDYGCTTVIGHHHSRFGSTGFKSPAGNLIFGVDSGCLISDKGSPYKYNKQDRSRPIQGCVIIAGGVPILLPL